MESDEILQNFRQEWQQEIETSSSSRGNGSLNEVSSPTEELASTSSVSQNQSVDSFQSDVECKAANLFTKGVQLEQNGQLYEAIKFYKRAIVLVPDIEIRVHQQMTSREEYNSIVNSPSDSNSEDDDDTVTEDFNDLITKFENILSCNHSLCSSMYSQDSTHISSLPAEMFETIFSWIVGKELDLESLDVLGRVCRGFYLLSRRPDLWRRACVCVWGINTGDLNVYHSYREMYIWRPRPRFNGCYISRTTYFRSGENSFQDQSYQPWRIVCYYRYLRFFPNGSVLMYTSSEEPQSVVGSLKKLESKHPQILSGHYRIHENSLTLLFRRSPTRKKHRFLRRDKGSTDVQETTFQVEVEIKSIRNRPHWQLWWQCYSIVSSFVSGSHATSVVDVSDTNNFPPFAFSKVRSYAAETEEPLT